MKFSKHITGKENLKVAHQFTNTRFKEAVNEGIHLWFKTRDTVKSNKEDKKKKVMCEYS